MTRSLLRRWLKPRTSATFRLLDSVDKQLPLVCVIDGSPSTKWMPHEYDDTPAQVGAAAVGFWTAGSIAAGFLAMEGASLLAHLGRKFPIGYLPYCDRCFRASGYQPPNRFSWRFLALIVGGLVILDVIVGLIWPAALVGVSTSSMLLAILLLALAPLIRNALNPRGLAVMAIFLVAMAAAFAVPGLSVDTRARIGVLAVGFLVVTIFVAAGLKLWQTYRHNVGEGYVHFFREDSNGQRLPVKYVDCDGAQDAWRLWVQIDGCGTSFAEAVKDNIGRR